MKSTHSQRQIFRMLADARRPSGRQGHLGPLLLTAKDRKVAFRLFPRRQAKGNPAASRSISKMSPLVGALISRALLSNFWVRGDLVATRNTLGRSNSTRPPSSRASRASANPSSHAPPSLPG